MGQVRHGCATTTHAMRKAIQRSQASIEELSRTYGINPKTVVKGRKRLSVEDRKTGSGQGEDRAGEVRGLHAKIGELTVWNDFLARTLKL